MISNYLKVAVRNSLKHKVFSAINIFGLALAMAVGMLIIVMLADQKSYDKFHANKDRIFRVLSDDGNSPFSYASSPVPLAAELKSNYPIVEEATQLVRGVGGDAIFKEKAVEMRGFFSDPSFFRVFSFSLEKGNSQTALSRPNSLVITGELAQKLFQGEDPIGKTVEFVDRGLHYLGGYKNEPPPTPWGSFVITGVFKEEGHKSHLRFDAIMSSSSMPLLIQEKKINDLTGNWENFYECFTYVMLSAGKEGKDLDENLRTLASLRYSKIPDWKNFKLISQSLMKITPGQFTANPTSFSMPLVGYYILSFLAIIILLSACLNYTNLSIARALTRAKEIGVRKVTGATRTALIIQFLSESILTALLAVAVALSFLFIMIPAFKGLWINQFLHFDLRLDPTIYPIFIGLAALIGILAGLFPALHLSRYLPIHAMKSNQGTRVGKMSLRKILGVSQFVFSLFFITTSLLIYSQFRHFLKFDYGLGTKNIVNIPLQGNDYQRIASAVSLVQGVESTSACDILPATGISNGTRLRAGDKVEDYKYVGAFGVDENFIGNFDIELLAGKNLPASSTSDRLILINEAGVRELGYANPLAIIGQSFQEENHEPVEVIGVVKDFRFRLLVEQNEVGPVILRHNSNYNFVNVKIDGNNLKETVAKLEQRWKTIDNVHAFKYEFFDEQLAKTHQAIFDGVSILGFISILAIIIACLGLLGMVTYTAERKTKEVGIRKILGAENSSIALLLSGGFFRMLLLSIAIGAPLSYFVNNLWLQNFPNRVEFGFGIILLAVSILIALGMLTIGSQTIKASRTNPVQALKD